MIGVTVGKKIKRWREKKEITQAELAKKSGLHPVTIAKIEVNMRPNPSLDTLQRIAKALRISLAVLLKD